MAAIRCSDDRRILPRGRFALVLGFAEIERVAATGLFFGTLGTNVNYADRGFDLAVYC